MLAGRFQVKTIRCKHLYSQVLEESMYLKLNSGLRSNTISSKVLKVLFMCMCVCPHGIHMCHMLTVPMEARKWHQIPQELKLHRVVSLHVDCRN